MLVTRIFSRTIKIKAWQPHSRYSRDHLPAGLSARLAFAIAKRADKAGNAGSHKISAASGFSLIEMTIISVIMAILLSVVIVNLRNSQHRIAVNTSAELVASALRAMQNNSLSGLPKPSGSSATNYGVNISESTPNIYSTYADLNLGTQELLEIENFVPGVEFQNIEVDGDSETSLDITFDLPYGTIQLNGDDGAANLGVVEIVHTTSGYGKRVIIKANTGDIEIRDL